MSDVVLVWTTHTRHRQSAEVLVVDAAHGAAAPVHVADLRKVGATARDEVTLAHPPGSSPPAAPVASAAPVAAPAAPLANVPATTPSAENEGRDRHLTWSAGNGEVRDAPSGSAPPRPVHVIGSEMLDVSVSGGAGTRSFSYSGAPAGSQATLRSYSMNGAPMFGLQGAVYPLADAHLPVLSDLGVVLGFSQAFALQSSSVDAGTQSTRWVNALAGGRFRLRTGTGHAPILGVTGAYESQSFTFSSSSAAGAGRCSPGRIRRCSTSRWRCRSMRACRSDALP